MFRFKLVVAAIVIAASAVPVLPAHAEGAVVIRDAGCIFFNGDGQFESLDNSQTVTTSQGGTKTCSGDVTPPSSGKAVHYDFLSTGVGCSTPAGITFFGWRETVSASGRAVVICVIR